MTYRGKRITIIGVAILVAIVVTIVIRRARPDADRRWNILLVTLDTTRADRLGCYDYRDARTPTFDSFSQQAVRYQRCYSPVPLTLPAHSTLLTGLTPPSHGVHFNGQNALPDAAVTLAEVLQEQGYSTSAVIAAFVLDKQFGLDQGFESYDDDMSRGIEGSRFQYAERDAQIVTDRSLELWKEAGDGPQFMWVHYFDPHAPYEPPGFDPTFAAQSGYDAEISYVDGQFQRLLEVVQASRRDTLVIVTADHGESLGEHGEQTHSYFAYDATLRVPLLVRFPDGRGTGQTVETPVSLADIFPSVLSWLGMADAAEAVDGANLPLETEVPLEPDVALPSSHPIYIESHTPAIYGAAPLVGIVAGAQKFILSPQPERYNLATDRHEEHNLFEQNDVLSQQLKELLEARFSELSQDVLQTVDVQITAQEAAKLHALGYVGGGATPLPDPAATLEEAVRGTDAKDKLRDFRSFQNAKALIEAGQTSAATEILIPLVATDPTVDRYRWTLTVIATEDPDMRPQIIESLAGAVAACEEARSDTYTLYHLGAALCDQQRLSEAIDVFLLLLETSPDDDDAHRRLADVYQRLGKTEEASQHLQRLEQLSDGLPEN